MDCKCKRAGQCYWHSTVVNNEQIAECKTGKPPKKSNPAPCVHITRENNEGRWPKADQQVYDCAIHGQCTQSPNKQRSGLKMCGDCGDYLPMTDNIADKWVDGLRIIDRNRNSVTHMRDMLRGGSAFLVCGGPSLKQVDMKRLTDRGVFSLGINNAAAYTPENEDPLLYPPTTSAFVCSDPPSKFHNGIFEDPKIIKFLPEPKLKKNRGKLRRCIKPGHYEYTGTYTAQCPNVFGFERRGWMAIDETWFTAPGAPWGNLKEGVQKLGEKKTVNTTFLGLRILQYLGAKTIFLLGADFHMSPDVGLHDNYAFGEQRESGAVNSNNNQYEISNDWLIGLRPIFEKFGFRTYNCNKHSHLRAFDFVDFETALRHCKSNVPNCWDIKDWYRKE